MKISPAFQFINPYRQDGKGFLLLLAVNLGLDGMSTRTDEVNDAGMVDMGFHRQVLNQILNRPPEMAPISGISTGTGNNNIVQFTVSACDPDGQPVTYSAGGLPDRATFDSYTRVFNWVPTYKQVGSHQVTFTASDGSLTDSETAAITVTNNPTVVFTPIKMRIPSGMAGLPQATWAGHIMFYSARRIPKAARLIRNAMSRYTANKFFVDFS